MGLAKAGKPASRSHRAPRAVYGAGTLATATATAPRRKPRTALVLSGGGSRGAYEAGVLSWIFENVYPRLGAGFEFDLVSGTSVGAIHAAYVAASAGLPPAERAKALIETWTTMRFDSVLRLTWRDFVGIPLRGLGLGPTRARGGDDRGEARGGLVDIAPLEALVRERIPWNRLRANLAAGTKPRRGEPDPQSRLRSASPTSNGRR